MKKIISVLMALMLAITISFNTPQEVKAESEIKSLIQSSQVSPLVSGPELMQLLISTVVSVLLSMGISITRYGVEQLFKQWNIDSSQYEEELNGQFTSVTDKMVVGAKTLALCYRVRQNLLSQGLTNNGSINIGSSSVNPGFMDYENVTVVSNIYGTTSINYDGSKYSVTVNRISSSGSPGTEIVFGIRYFLIPLLQEPGNHTYYTPIISIDNTNNFTLNASAYGFTTKEEAYNLINTFKKNELYYIGSYYYNYEYKNVSTIGYVDKNTGKFTYGYNENIRYAVIIYRLNKKGSWSTTVGETMFSTNISITKNPNTESNIPIISESTETVTAGKIDLTDWQKVNPNYTYELELENSTDSAIISSNQALIDAINSNTVAIKNQQVIDKNTGLTVTDINTNVIGISDILNGISNVITSIKEWFISLVQPITNVFTKTYTIEEINALAWVNVINELVLTIQNGITQILPFYQNNIGSILNTISHPQTNLLTQAVNTILTNTNLYWAVYGIAAIIFMKGVMR